MSDKTYNRIMSIVLLVIGTGGVLVSMMHAIPTYGALGLVPLIISVGALVLGLDKKTD